MMTIFKKEFRDLLPWIAVGMILIAALCWSSASDSELSGYLSIGFAAVALAFGFLQTIGDMRTDAKGYLLHRPVSTKSIYWGKLLAGLVAYVLTIAVPLIGLAIYYLIMGPEREPVSVWQLVPTVLMSIVAFAFHPAAIWAMSRQAKWVGSKSIPLGVAALGCLLAFSILTTYVTQAYVTLAWVGFVASVLATLWVTVAAAARAFCDDQFSPTAHASNRLFRIGNIGILAACGFAFSFVAITIMSIFWKDATYPYTNHELALADDGQLWDYVQTTTSPDGYWDPDVAIAKIDPEKEVVGELQPLPDNWVERKKVSLFNQDHRRVWKRSFNYRTQFMGSGRDYWSIYEHENRLLIYAKGLRGVLTPSGFYDSLDDAQGAFSDPEFMSSNGYLTDRRTNYKGSPSVGESLISDRNGVYQVDWKTRTIRTVLNQPNDHVALVLPESDQDAVFWVKNGSDMMRYLIEPLDEDGLLELADAELVERARNYRFPEIKTTQTNEWSFGTDAIDKSLIHGTNKSIGVSETADGETLFYRDFYGPLEETRYQIRTPDDVKDVEGAVVFPAAEMADQHLLGLAVPPAIAVAIISFFAPSTALGFSSSLIGYLLFHVLLAVALTFWLTRYYDLSAFSRNVWLLVAVLLGMAAPLAMWMIYPKLIREVCHHCESMRRIDRSRCRQCNADWAKAPLDGNEIIGTASNQKLPASV